MNEDFAYKLRQLMLPAAALSFLLLAAYSALNWFLLSRTELLTEEVVDYGLPLFLATLLELGIFLPRIRRLDLGQKNKSFFYNVVALALLATPVVLAQSYIRDAQAQTTHLADASMIPNAARTKFYVADKICASNKDAVAAKPVITTNGRHNEYLNITFYVVVPVCAPDVYIPTNPSVLDSSPSGPSRIATGAWIGLKFFKSLDNGQNRTALENEFQAFAHQVDQDVANLDPASYRYLERNGHNMDRRYYDKALANGHVASPDSQILLIPHREALPPHNNDGLMMTMIALVVGTVIWSIMVTMAPLGDERPRSKEQFGLAELIIPSRKSYGLPILIDLNVAVFLAMAFAGLGFIDFDSDDLVAWGANFGPAVMHGQVWRLITSQFVHGGAMHLANNMYGLLIEGVFLTTVLPNWRMILAYLVTGLGGAIAGFVLHPDIVSVGASGAILGLWGVLVALALLGDARIGDQKKVLLTNGAIFAGLTIAVGSVTPGIDNTAHIGGFITGMVVGSAIFLLDRQRKADAAVP